MQKKGFTIIEVVVVFLLILGVTFLFLPKGLDNTRQARFISKWTEKYSEIEYMFSVIKAQKDSEIQAKLKNAQDSDGRSEAVIDTIKPFLRITSDVKDPTYKQHYMDKTLVKDQDRYYFGKFYQTSDNEIVGLKWLKEHCNDGDACAIMAFDMNGAIPPNTWGYDVFGIELLKDKISPLGKDADSDTLKKNCSKRGYGTYCSYYYLIGGKFD